MTTCHACGSETTPGAACVVCGAAPLGHEPDEPGTAGGDRADQPRAHPSAQPTPPAGATPPGDATPPAGATPPGDATPPGPPPPPPPGSAAVPATPQPHPDAVVVTESARNWGMVAHLSALVSAGLGGLIFLGPLLVWLVKKDDDQFVRHHAVEALNFNLSLTIYALVGFLLIFTLVGIPLTIVGAIIGLPLWFIASIVAAVRAQRGEAYRYPLTIRLVTE